jgi:hypothetical protein
VIARSVGPVRDPTLYRAVCFLGWTPRESLVQSASRLSRLQQLLRDLDWIPEAASIPDRGGLQWVHRVLWDEWSSHEGWNVHRSAQAYHETIVVLMGVEQDGPCPALDEWLPMASAFWESHCGQSGAWSATAGLPQLAADVEPAHLLGQAWVWTGEWEQPPEGGWERFGGERYGPDGFVPFPWGVLGYRADRELPVFALHTTTGLKAGRDEFLFSNLTVLIAEFVKATQFLRDRYQDALAPALDRLERELLAATEPDPRSGQRLSLQATERQVRDLTQLLFQFSQRLADLDEDARGLELARDAVAHLLGRAQAGEGPRPPGEGIRMPLERLAQQVRSDLAYYRASDERGRRALEAHRTLVEIEQARGQTRLTVAGILVGSFVGVGQILPDTLEFPIRLGASAGVGIALTGLYWWLSGRKRA